jgi:hypothetical protein
VHGIINSLLLGLLARELGWGGGEGGVFCNDRSGKRGHLDYSCSITMWEALLGLPPLFLQLFGLFLLLDRNCVGGGGGGLLKGVSRYLE